MIGQLSEMAYSVLVTGERLNNSSARSYQQMLQQMEDTGLAYSTIEELSVSVREIAENTGNASKAIGVATGEAEQGKKLVNLLGATVERLVNEVGHSSSASTQQAAVSEQVSESMSNIAKMTTETMSIAQANSEHSNVMVVLFKKLLRQFSFFDVSDDYEEVVSKAHAEAGQQPHGTQHTASAKQASGVEMF